MQGLRTSLDPKEATAVIHVGGAHVAFDPPRRVRSHEGGVLEPLDPQTLGGGGGLYDSRLFWPGT